MSYAGGLYGDDGIPNIDLDELATEVFGLQNVLDEVVGVNVLTIEMNVYSEQEYEIGISGGKLDEDETEWVANIDELKILVTKMYPELDWEDSGWDSWKNL